MNYRQALEFFSLYGNVGRSVADLASTPPTFNQLVAAVEHAVRVKGMPTCLAGQAMDAIFNHVSPPVDPVRPIEAATDAIADAVAKLNGIDERLSAVERTSSPAPLESAYAAALDEIAEEGPIEEEAIEPVKEGGFPSPRMGSAEPASSVAFKVGDAVEFEPDNSTYGTIVRGEIVEGRCCNGQVIVRALDGRKWYPRVVKLRPVSTAAKPPLTPKEPMTLPAIVGILNRFRHRGFTTWGAIGFDGQVFTASGASVDFGLTAFEAEAVAREYRRRGDRP